ncbi:Tfp pilus assembly protein PilF [Pseudomonas sp. SLBN-26]|uniref:cold shock domain-containing protein n=1 Tax=Pseudomonadaceae TaxID=135621 RepID=UPI0011548248|nr:MULTISPECIES: cold shock domain-containing protein [Pseudomonas]MCP1615895.1 cold shock CspA family protein [Pseudomonas otitidis]TQL05162.1 Tfp pilus assembly protein PilF [Pseudomonas sp. SLBN-26]
MSENYNSGTVISYDDKAGYGYIDPDDPELGEESILVHRKSIRDQSLLLSPGDRVLFHLSLVPRGYLAIDVHDEPREPISDTGLSQGKISNLKHDRKFGFIEDSVDGRIFFHFSQLIDTTTPIEIGLTVTFQKQVTSRGLQAFQVTPQFSSANSKTTNETTKSNYLAQAILARDSKQFDEAVRLYELGMSETPSVQLVTSYAAMEKNRNRRKEALRVYEAGLRIFPTNIKLLEDLGILYSSIGNSSKAIDTLRRGLELSNDTNQDSARRFQLAIARVYIKKENPSRDDLSEAIRYYERAQQAFEASSQATFPRDDKLAMSIAKIRLQHHRGELAHSFISSGGFRIIRASLFEQKTAGSDFIIEPTSSELLEGYGISGNLLLRCIFKSEINRADIESIDNAITSWGTGNLVDEQVVLLLVSSLSEHVERLLYQRLEDRKRTVPAIVPITQSQIETAKNGNTALRDVLDRWLFRRDLFAQNFPVSGRRFFGREKPLHEIRDAISNGTAAGIFGLRKVGKTSLLKEIERRANEGGDIVIYMDLLRVPADINDTRWLYWKLSSELYKRSGRSEFRGLQWRLGGHFTDYLDIPNEFPVATAFDSDLNKILNTIRDSRLSPRPKVVIMLDEIERIIPNASGKEGFDGFFNFFSYLRGVAQESGDFVPIVTGANAAIAEAAQFAGRDNPVFNFFKEIYLPLLGPQESFQMINTLGRGMGTKFPEPVIERIHSLTGGHPFFTRQFCSYICRRYSDRPLNVSLSMIEELISPYLDSAGRDFREIIERFSRDYPEELSVCLEVARSGGKMKLSDLQNDTDKALSIRHLIGYQIVSVTDNTISLTMEFLLRWLKNGEMDHA